MYSQPEPEAFTRAFKLRGSIISAGLQLGAFFVPLGLGFVGLMLTEKTLGEGVAAVFGISGFALAIVLSIIAMRKVFLVGNTDLRRNLAAAIARRIGRNPDDGRALFVGWTPGATVMPKDMETDHDVGFLTLTPERMIYLGDTVHFELHRSQVFEITYRQEGIPFLFDMGKRILIRWVDEYGQANAFTMERREGVNKPDVRRKNQELSEVLLRWQQSGIVPDAMAAPAPAVGEEPAAPAEPPATTPEEATGE